MDESYLGKLQPRLSAKVFSGSFGYLDPLSLEGSIIKHTYSWKHSNASDCGMLLMSTQLSAVIFATAHSKLSRCYSPKSAALCDLARPRLSIGSCLARPTHSAPAKLLEPGNHLMPSIHPFQENQEVT